MILLRLAVGALSLAGVLLVYNLISALQDARAARETLAQVQAELTAATASQLLCEQNVAAILQDKARDDEIDNLGDDALRNIPDSWRLLPGDI